MMTRRDVCYTVFRQCVSLSNTRRRRLQSSSSPSLFASLAQFLAKRLSDFLRPKFRIAHLEFFALLLGHDLC
jgi:hypothetical protein